MAMNEVRHPTTLEKVAATDVGAEERDDVHSVGDPDGKHCSGERYVWHYTTGQCHLLIVADGFIKPAKAYIAKGERPAAWFSKRQDFEMTARKGCIEPDGTRRTLTVEETCKRGGGLVRFGLPLDDARLVSWRAFKATSGIPASVARGLVKVAKEQGADARDWMVSFEPIPVTDCTVDVMASLDGPWERVQALGTFASSAD